MCRLIEPSKTRAFGFSLIFISIAIICFIALCAMPNSNAYAATGKKADIQAKLNAKQSKAAITISGTAFKNAKQVSVPVWSQKGGQDDIVWYPAKKSNGSWKVTVSISKHKTDGDYLVHVYALIGSSKKQRFMGDTAFSIDPPTATTVVSNINHDKGMFDVIVSDVAAKSGIAEVSVPIWTRSKQQDIRWYPASKQKDGTWKVTVTATDHWLGSDYRVHTYVTAKNGVTSCTGTTTAKLKIADGIRVAKDPDSTDRLVWVKCPAKAKKVSVPVWSSVKGQDDIVWYPAKKISSGIWCATVKCENLKHAGTVVAHVYVSDKYCGSAKFKVTAKDINSNPLKAITKASKSGLSSMNCSFNFNSKAGKKLQKAISKVKSRGRDVGFVMVDIKSGKGIAYNAGKRFYCASTIKGPYVAAINKYAAGAVGPATRATMSSTIRVSSQESYFSLRRSFGSSPMAKFQKYVGGVSFSASATFSYMTSKDLAKMWVGCYKYFFTETNSNSKWCRSLYTDPCLSYIRAAFAGKYTTYSKAGWISEGSYYLARDDAGIVMAGNRPYVVAIMSTAYGQDSDLRNLALAIDAVHDVL